MRVLLVEDSRTVRSYVEAILRDAGDIELLPSAIDGATGVALAIERRPDVILMDLELPVLDGIGAIREIMAAAPCPIVVLSGQLEEPARDRTFESFQAGAADVLAKPRGLGDEEIERFGERLLRVVRVMRGARVLRRGVASFRRSLTPMPARLADVVLIGASTGGPLVVRRILEGIPAPYPLPIVICQHIVPGFEHGFAAWLEATGHRVTVVGPGDKVQAGIVHVARADRQLALRGRELLLLPREEGRPAPSADVLFESASAWFGARCVALLLTGMGEDGKRGMLALRQKGALTVTQTAQTCVIDGMPAAARAAGASQRDLSPAEMCELLREVVGAPASARKPA
ncbi:chemotaxis protein CheB [Polyangium aurulentum]|uniref:chemotaxis protein CheB n=1 Tax=Polyangium aurulentum TaxID=2567896 RepID=UPI0010AEBB50|nr:chemotaxis protein CheB [Polyangium aurulentum]UQA62435.1 response regulator [Polyangium aurulentum]